MRAPRLHLALRMASIFQSRYEPEASVMDGGADLVEGHQPIDLAGLSSFFKNEALARPGRRPPITHVLMLDPDRLHCLCPSNGRA